MELYEIKEKVGSDPCLVLDFDFDATVKGTDLILSATIKNVNSEAEAQKYINEYVDLIEKNANTRCIVFSGTVHASGALEAMNNTKLYITNLAIVKTNYGRTLATVASVNFNGTDIKQIYLILTYVNNNEVIFEGQVSLT